MSDEQDDPLDRIFVSTEDGDHRMMGGQEIDAEAFRARLDSLADAAEAVEDLATEANNLSQTGLDDDDLVALLVGRKPSRRSLRDVEAFVDTLQDIQDTSTNRLLIRLLADLSTLTQNEAEEFLDELRELHDRYPPETDR